MTRSDSEVLKWWPSFHHCCAISLHKIIIRFQCLVSGCRYTKELFQHSPPFADLGVLIYTSLTLESLYLFHGKRVLKFVLLSQNSHSNQDRWIDGTEKEREREREREKEGEESSKKIKLVRWTERVARGCSTPTDFSLTIHGDAYVAIYLVLRLEYLSARRSTWQLVSFSQTSTILSPWTPIVYAADI